MFQTLYIICATLGIISIILIIHAFLLEKKLKNLFQGQNGMDLEKIILDMQSRINSQNAHVIKNANDLQNVNDKLRKRVRNVSTLRFKPFEDAGSNQSFAIAIIDDDANGVILSSLYTRERMSVFAKPVVNGKSEFELTNEEKNVLESAKLEV